MDFNNSNIILVYINIIHLFFKNKFSLFLKFFIISNMYIKNLMVILNNLCYLLKIKLKNFIIFIQLFKIMVLIFILKNNHENIIK